MNVLYINLGLGFGSGLWLVLIFIFMSLCFKLGCVKIKWILELMCILELKNLTFQIKLFLGGNFFWFHKYFYFLCSLTLHFPAKSVHHLYNLEVFTIFVHCLGYSCWISSKSRLPPRSTCTTDVWNPVPTPDEPSMLPVSPLSWFTNSTTSWLQQSCPPSRLHAAAIRK